MIIERALLWISFLIMILSLLAPAIMWLFSAILLLNHGNTWIYKQIIICSVKSNNLAVFAVLIIDRFSICLFSTNIMFGLSNIWIQMGYISETVIMWLFSTSLLLTYGNNWIFLPLLIKGRKKEKALFIRSHFRTDLNFDLGKG